MKKVLRKSKLVAGILVLVVVCLGIVLAGDVIVKEGDLNVSGDLTTTGTGTFGTGGVRLLDAWDNYMSLKFSGFEEDVTLTLALDYDARITVQGNTFLADWFDQNVKRTGSPSFAGITTTGTVAAGTVESVKFKSTGCTADGTKAVAFGYDTEASGDYSTAMGKYTTATGDYSTAMGHYAAASGNCSTTMGIYTEAIGTFSTAMGSATRASGGASTAMGFWTTAGPADFTTAIGAWFTNDVQYSFAVGFGQKDFSVERGLVTVGDVGTNDANLYVTGWVDADQYLTHSSFYDKDSYGRALDYSEDSSKIVKLNAQGKKEYNHEADPVFLQKSVTVKDYDTYTEEEVWDELLNKTITRRIYETHQELRSNLGMKVAWLRQCVFELKQENQMLKAELAKLKEAVGIE